MNKRERLEAAVERAAARSRRLIDAGAPMMVIHGAQDAWSDAVAKLASYLLETGEPGWIRSARLRQCGTLERAS